MESLAIELWKIQDEGITAPITGMRKNAKPSPEDWTLEDYITAPSPRSPRSNPVSGRRLPKTGIFAVLARDFLRIRSSCREIGSTRHGTPNCKSPLLAGLSPAIEGLFSEPRNAWLATQC